MKNFQIKFRYFAQDTNKTRRKPTLNEEKQWYKQLKNTLKKDFNATLGDLPEETTTINASTLKTLTLETPDDINMTDLDSYIRKPKTIGHEGQTVTLMQFKNLRPLMG